MPISFTEKELRDAVENSYCYSDVLRCLGMCTKGRNRDTIKKYISKWKISTCHFLSFKELIAKRKEEDPSYLHKNTIESILVVGSKIGSSKLKKRLYQEKYKEPICELCGQDENWLGKKISLILDHINGINNDNRIENLRIVCPNCNATLDTHCGKNLKQIHKCLDCNKKISNKQTKRCVSCAGKIRGFKNRKVKRPPYNQLIVEVKEFGYVGTGKKYGVSDNAIRKWIKYYESSSTAINQHME